MKTIRIQSVFTNRSQLLRRPVEWWRRRAPPKPSLAETATIIAPAGLRIRARHVESAKRMHTHQRARTFAIQIKIADVKLFPRAPCFASSLL